MRTSDASIDLIDQDDLSAPSTTLDSVSRPGEVTDRLDLSLPAGASVIVLSDLHLRQASSPESAQIERELAERLSRFTGPGAVVLNGDLVELWGEPDGTVDRALDAHPVLTQALSRFAGQACHEVVLVVGNHDGPVGWDDLAAAALSRRLRCRATLVLDLQLHTAAGPRRVRCEHGHAFDPANAMRDPRNRLDSPLGQHIVQEVLPHVSRLRFLRDLGSISDPNASGQFVASRFLYRELGSRAWWLLIPILLTMLLRIPLIVRALARSDMARLSTVLLFVSAGLLINVTGLGVVVALLARRVYGSLAASRLGPRGAHSNGAPCAAAAALCAQGFAGLITGHTHQPELTPVPGGFYANSGCCLTCVEQRPARLGLPPVFAPVLRRSWLELETGRDLQVRLILGESPTGTTTRLERLLIRRPRSPAARPTTPEVISELPGGPGWPLRCLDLDRRRRHERVRGWAARAVIGVGLLSLVSALTLPLQGRLRELLGILPIEVPQTAAASAAFLSVALILLGRGLLRGHRLAWQLAVGLLGISAILSLVKGIDIEEALVAVLAASWLARQRDAFPVQPASRPWRWPAWVVFGLGGVLAASSGLVLVTGQQEAAELDARALAERLLGNSSLPLTSASRFVTPALIAAGFAVLMACGLLLTRPRRRHQPTPAQHRADLERARRLVLEHGGDTLSYFALRDDKSWFFTGDCVVAYDIRDGVCLVSPDPIGPPEQWASAWAEFSVFADRHGWPVTVIGAAAGWLPIYQAAGLRSLYIGDEAIVDCTRFTLEGRPMKGLRSAYHRVQRAGYEVRFFDPARLALSWQRNCGACWTRAWRGQVERGFSMTLSRVFDPRDTGLLLAVAFRPDGRAAGFCQWAPAADIAGWSLELMRRSAEEDLPNGLTDFIIIETVQQLRARGQWGLSLNFAVMRSVLAGEQGDGMLNDLQCRVLTKFSDSMQIASLWHYNKKFKPYWRPRYVALGRLSSAPAQGLAIADAEGVTELPLIGQFLGRAHRAQAGQAAHTAGTEPARELSSR